MSIPPKMVRDFASAIANENRKLGIVADGECGYCDAFMPLAPELHEKARRFRDWSGHCVIPCMECVGVIAREGAFFCSDACAQAYAARRGIVDLSRKNN